MKKHTPDSQNRALLMSIILVFGYVMLAFFSTIPFNEIGRANNNDQVYAGTQESVDRTVDPSSFLDGNDESIDSTITPRPTTTPRATATLRAATVIPSATVFSSPSATPFDFFSDIASPTPEATIPPFDLNLPEEQGTISTPTPTPIPAIVEGSNNQFIIIGGIVTAIVLILIVVGIILMRRSRDNTPPPMMPQAGIGNDAPPMPPNGPQYPPYINQQ